MDPEPISFHLSQPTLFNLNDPSTGALELFPAVWSAVEDLASQDVQTRLSALDRLNELHAPRFSPLVAYFIATRIIDPDLTLRAKVVRTLGEVLKPDDQGRTTPDTVRSHLNAYLSQMRTRPIYALLELSVTDPSLDEHIARLLNFNPFGSNHLIAILTDRKVLMPIRKKATQMIGLVGYLDAIPALERLQSRLETRLNGQQSMSFVTPATPEETELLPEVRNTLNLLQAQ
jgi:hypothetical protein